MPASPPHHYGSTSSQIGGHKMRLGSNGEAGHGNGQSRDAAQPPASPEDLTEFARKYFAEDFPNSARDGCPPADTFDKLLAARGLPGEALRGHLFGCSECFREYAAALRRHRAEAPAVTVSAWTRIARLVGRVPVPALAALTAALVLCFGAIALWLNGPGNSPTSSRADANLSAPPSPIVREAAQGAAPTPSPERGSTESRAAGSSSQAKDIPRAVNVLPRSPVAASLVTIDLAGYVLLRAGDGGEATAAQTSLPPAECRLRILLPEGSPAGLYRVGVVDAFGVERAGEKIAAAQNGRLKVTLNLRDLPGCKCRLRISRGNEAPTYYPILVTDRGSPKPRRVRR